MTFYHFTSHMHLAPILMSEMLRPSESNVGAPFNLEDGPVGTHVGPDVVWLLDNSEFDQENDRHHGLSLPKRNIRFEVDVKAVRWLDWAPARIMSPEWKKFFLSSAGGAEAAEHWYVFPAPIRSRRWVGLTDMTTGEEINYKEALA